ncbi:hypothetical protein PtB15_9B180 [Puccinia triticina]|nr:hypothetical protein PtB15_9B180 [Puccinia triticina]
MQKEIATPCPRLHPQPNRTSLGTCPMRKAQDLASSLTQSKRTWVETGIVPDDEDIKIAQPTSPSRPPVSMGKPFGKLQTSRRTATKPLVKPVDLLHKPPASTSTLPALNPTHQPSIPTTNEPSPWADGPQPASSNVPSSSTPGIQQPTMDITSTKQPPKHNSEQAGPNVPLHRECPPAFTGAIDPTTLSATQETASAPAGTNAPPRSPHSDHGPAAPTHHTSSQHHTTGPINHDQSSSGQTGGPARVPQEPATCNSNRPQTGSPLAREIALQPQLTIIKSNQIRTQLHLISKEFSVTRPSWSKYVATWEALAPLLNNCARACQYPPPAPDPICLQRTACSYATWIQTIHSLGDKFLTYLKNEQWYCLDLVEFPLLTSFGQKDDSLRPALFIPTTIKSDHPESALVCCLYQLHSCPQHITSDWARIVATSVKLMADNLFNPPPVRPNPTDDQITRGVQALLYLDTLKNSSSSFDQTSDQSEPGQQQTQRMHSVDVLHDFRNVIIDVLMAYIILQTHSLSEAPLKAAKKKATKRANQISPSNSNQTVSDVNASLSAINTAPPDATQTLQKYQKKKKTSSLLYTSSLAEFKGSSSHQGTTGLLESPPSPDKICSVDLVKVPSRFELAEAITNDFINQWNTLNPTSPFLIPQTPGPITGH